MKAILAAIKMALAVPLLAAAWAANAAATLSAWYEAGRPDAISVVMGGNNPAILIARRDAADPMRSTDGGATWTPFTVLGNRPVEFQSSPVDSALFYAITGPMIESGQYAQPGGLYRSIDAGATWQLVNPQLAGEGGGGLGYLKVGAGDGLLYATRRAAALCYTGSCSYEGDRAYRSRDGGVTWRTIDAGLGPAGEVNPSRALAVASSDASVVYAATRNALYRSDDQGDTWKSLYETSPQERVVELVVDRRDAHTLYARPDSSLQIVTCELAACRLTRADHVPGPNRQMVADPAQAGRVYIIGYAGEIYESRDRALTWNRVGPAGRDIRMPSANAFGLTTSVPAVGLSGDDRVMFVATAYGSDVAAGLRRTVVREDALALGSDLWWNPSQSGAGWSITQHESGQMFVVWYSYDSNGAPMWRAMSGGTWTDSRTFTSPVYATTGPAYFKGAFDPGAVAVTLLGTATLRFEDSNNAIFTYQFGSAGSGETRISRQLFGPPDPHLYRPENYADLWWNAAESGWGFAFSQQYSTAFAAWYVYDDAGKPLWVVMPEGQLGWETIGNQSYWSFFGDIYTTRGPRFGDVFDPAQVVVTPVGKAGVTFVGRDRAFLAYEAFGRSERRELTRQPF